MKKIAFFGSNFTRMDFFEAIISHSHSHPRNKQNWNKNICWLLHDHISHRWDGKHWLLHTFFTLHATTKWNTHALRFVIGRCIHFLADQKIRSRMKYTHKEKFVRLRVRKVFNRKWLLWHVRTHIYWEKYKMDDIPLEFCFDSEPKISVKRLKQ